MGPRAATSAVTMVAPTNPANPAAAVSNATATAIIPSSPVTPPSNQNALGAGASS
jgi:hypothetical protein